MVSSGIFIFISELASKDSLALLYICYFSQAKQFEELK